MKEVKIDGASIIIDGKKVFERPSFYRSVIEVLRSDFKNIATWIYRYSYSSGSGGQNINYTVFAIKDGMAEPKSIDAYGTNTQRMPFNRMTLDINEGTKEIIVSTTDNKGCGKKVLNKISYSNLE